MTLVEAAQLYQATTTSATRYQGDTITQFTYKEKQFCWHIQFAFAETGGTYVLICFKGEKSL